MMLRRHDTNKTSHSTEGTGIEQRSANARNVLSLLICLIISGLLTTGCGLAVIETNVPQAELYRSRHGTNEWKRVRPLFRESFFIRDHESGGYKPGVYQPVDTMGDRGASEAINTDTADGLKESEIYPEAIAESDLPDDLKPDDLKEGTLEGNTTGDLPPGKAQPAVEVVEKRRIQEALEAPPLPQLAERIWVWRPFGGYAFLRAASDGYLASPPKLVDFNRFGARWARLELQPSLAEEARRRLEAGQVYWRNRWVDPEVHGLVNYEGEWMTEQQVVDRQRIAAGLVEFEGNWITPEKRQELIATQRRAEGLEFYKGRFRTEAEISRLKETALEMNTIRKEVATSDRSTTRSAIIDVSGLQPNRDLSILKLFNATGFGIQIIVDSEEYIEGRTVPAYDEVVIEMPPGDYEIAAIPASPGLGDLYFGVSTFAGQRRYTFVYNGNPPDIRNLDEVLTDEAQTDIIAPTIQVPELPPRPDAQQRQERPEGAQGAGGRRGGGTGGGGGGGGRPR